jgi:hypothetical protein
MKKLLSITTVSLLGVLTACGGGNSEGEALSEEEISEEWDLEMSHNGFALEDNETDWVNSRNDQLNVMEERFYIGEYESKRYALLSNDDHYYTIEIYTFGEYSEGLQVRAGQVIEHFEWTP